MNNEYATPCPDCDQYLMLVPDEGPLPEGQHPDVERLILRCPEGHKFTFYSLTREINAPDRIEGLRRISAS